MKRLFFIALSLLICVGTYAQHKPLKHIEIKESAITQVRTENRNNYTNTINTYSASALLSLRVSHEKGIKYPELDYELWSASYNVNDDKVSLLKSMAKLSEGFGGLLIGATPMTLSIGESNYIIDSWYLGTQQIMIDLNKTIIEHISVSGLQSIRFGSSCYVEFGDTEQELWRRCAKEVFDKRKHL